MVINRYDMLSYISRYWSKEEPSNIGAGLLKRDNETFLITKTYGRTDIVLINHKDGKQYTFGPKGWAERVCSF